MRTLELKKTDKIDYLDLLLAIVRTPIAGGAQGGTTAPAMRRDIRILDVLEPAKPGDTVRLEEADWSHLRMKVEAYPFGVSSRHILAMVDDVISAPEAE